MISDRLKKLRNAKKLTQEEAAQKMGIVRSTYSNYESGNREPDFETAKRIADFFGVSVDDLLGIEEKDPVDKLIKYLEYELTNEQIRERMTFMVDDITLSAEEVDEFITFVRVKRAMKKRQPASASKSEEL